MVHAIAHGEPDIVDEEKQEEQYAWLCMECGHRWGSRQREPEEADPTPDALAALVRLEELRRLRSAMLRRLTKEEREVLKARFVRGLDLDAVATELGTSERKVRTIQLRAAEKLTEAVAPELVVELPRHRRGRDHGLHEHVRAPRHGSRRPDAW
jgi:RNA polymerase sigma factor (sigma-70 family)